MKVTNTSKALQGVNTKSGRVFIRPGETKDVKLEGAGLKQAKRLEFLTFGGGKAEKKGKEPDEPKPADDALKAIHHGGGKFNIVKGDDVLASGLTKADADTFNAMSDEDKAAYIEASNAS